MESKIDVGTGDNNFQVGTLCSFFACQDLKLRNTFFKSINAGESSWVAKSKFNF
jgi:hypothetical protein